MLPHPNIALVFAYNEEPEMAQGHLDIVFVAHKLAKPRPCFAHCKNNPLNPRGLDLKEQCCLLFTSHCRN
jgi:hypothetical protein